MEETKIIYYMDDDKMPYLIKLNMAPDKAKLKDFKQSLNTVNSKMFKYFFQTVVDGFGVVKEEIMEDEAHIPMNDNGRAIAWLVQVEGSLAGSDNRSTNSFNLNDFNSNSNSNINKQQNDDVDKHQMQQQQQQQPNQQFSSMQSVTSTTSSNNENLDTNRKSSTLSSNSNKNNQNQQQIYDTLNSRKNSLNNNNNKMHHRQITTPLKDLNFDDTSTETESLINAFDDLRMKQHQKNNMAGTNSNTGSLNRRPNKPHFSSFNTHAPHPQSKPVKQKLSLDSHQTNRAHHGHGHHPYQSQQHHYQQQLHHQQQHHHHHHHNHHLQHLKNHNKHADSFSDDDDDDDESEILNDDTNLFTRTETTSGAAPSILSSDLDTTTFFDTENDDDDGQFSSITAETTNSTLSSRRYGQNRNRKRLRHKLHHSNYFKGHNSLHSSVSSLTDSTMSLNIITVTLSMDTVNFLGISIVGQSNKGGEGGIYVGSIMNGGAVALDGRIEPGDMILQVNDISFENMSNDDAVKVLREAVMKPGPVKLVVAKCWDPNPKGYFTVSKQEPVRPIDPSAWVAHTQAHTGIAPLGNNPASSNNNFNQIYHNGGLRTGHHRLTHSISSFGSNSSLTTSIADTTLTTTYNNGGGHYNYHGNGVLATTATTMNGGDSTRFGGNEQLNLTTDTDMETVVRSMAAPDSGLDIRDRNWLKITIPMAFIGSDVVDWLFNHVEGFPDRRDARKYACNLLKYGYIRHAVNKLRFSEQCYYIFGDFNQSTLNSQMNGQNGQTLFTLNEESEADFDSVSEFDRDTLYAPMNFPPPGSYNTNNIYQQHQPKIYSNLNGIGIGGPPPPASYMSSSSSNATSNSTSTTSNNTTSQTIATSTSVLGAIGQNGSLNSTSNNGGIINSDRSNACQFYYPPPQLQLTSFNNTANSTNISSSSMLFKQHYDSQSQDETVNQTATTTQQSQYTIDISTNNTTNFNNTTLNPPNSMLSQSQFSYGNSTNYTNSQNINDIKNSKNSNSNYQQQQQQPQQFQNITNSVYNNSGGSLNKLENRSIRSSDNSSSGNASDVELLSSSKSKNSSKRQSQKQQQQQQQQQIQYQKQQQIFYQQSTNYYEIGPLTSSINNNNLTKNSQEPRSLDKVPREMRLSKQSFSQAMENPCEFFVDVM